MCASKKPAEAALMFVVSMKKQFEGQVRQCMYEHLVVTNRLWKNYRRRGRRHRHSDDFAVDWALSWRVRPDRDIYIEKDVQAVGFDPSQAPPTVPQHHPTRLVGSRVAIDATKKHEYPAIAIPPKDHLDWVNDHWRDYAIED
jgi:3-polyprenyl-4-hydroxybenzoate decarboxylase